MAEIILHAFNWRYQEISAKLPEIAQIGYSAVLIPPPLYSDEYGTEWWQCYQPKDYRVLRSHLGNKSDLQELIQTAHGLGLKIFADIVFNHMANEESFRQEDPYYQQHPDEILSFPGYSSLRRYEVERECFERDKLYGNLSEGLFCKWDFHEKREIKNFNMTREVVEHWLGGLPDLRFNSWVVEQQKLCLQALNGMGFDGYRVDAIKHLSIDHVHEVFESGILDGKFVFGESLTSNDHEEQLFLWPLASRTQMTFYDFPLHETLRRAFAPRGSLRELVDPGAYGQALSWERALTFTVTHDIPNNAVFRGALLPAQIEFLANAYVFGREGGIPMVYSDHNESTGEYPEDLDRWASAWNRADLCAMIAFRQRVGDAPQKILFEDDLYLVFARGDFALVVINKSKQKQSPQIWTYGLRHGRYECLIHQTKMEIGGVFAEIEIEAEQAQMWIWKEEV